MELHTVYIVCMGHWLLMRWGGRAYLLSDDVELEGRRSLVCEAFSVDVVDHDLVVSSGLLM